MRRQATDDHRRPLRPFARLGRASGDAGSVLVVVLALSMVATTGIVVALATASASVEQARAYGRVTGARLAAESGIQATLAAMRGASSYAFLPPCASSGTLPSAGPAAAYAVRIAYAADAFAMPCPLTGQPTSATITATGTSGAASVGMQAVVHLADTPAPLPAFHYAVYSSSYVTMDSGASLTAGTAGTAGTATTAMPSVYAGTTFSCTNTNVVEGNVEVFAPASRDTSLSSACRVKGTLYVDGPVELSNTVDVGSLETFGGGLAMNTSARVAGAAYVSGGGITMYNTATIGGPAAATGAVAAPGGSIAGTVCSGSASCIPAGVAMPPTTPFPVLDPTSWPPGDTVDTVPATRCNGFGTYQYPGGSVSASPFAVDVAQAPAGGTTVIDASACTSGVTLEGASTLGNGTCPTGGLSTYTLSGNLVVVVGSLDDYGCNTFVSGPGGPYDLAIVVPDPIPSRATGELSFTNTTTFDPNVNLLLYTPGEANFNCNDSLTGQIVAGKVYTTNSFDMAASSAASSLVPGSTQPAAELVTLVHEVILSD